MDTAKIEFCEQCFDANRLRDKIAGTEMSGKHRG